MSIGHMIHGNVSQSVNTQERQELEQYLKTLNLDASADLSDADSHDLMDADTLLNTDPASESTHSTEAH